MHLYKIFSLAIFLTLCLSACTQESPPKTVIRPVLTQTVEIKENSREATYAGEVKARYNMALGFRIGGKIVERFVEVGQVVAPGTLLARLDPQDSNLQLLNAEGGLEAAQAEKRKAELDLKRYTKLFKQKMISAAEHLRFSNALAIAEARYTQAKANLDVARNQSSYTRLYADKGGVIVSLNMEVGQVVVAGQTVVNVALPDEKEVVIAVAENRLNEVHNADDVKVSLWANPDKYYKGKIREISPGADPVTRTYRVKISLLDDDPLIQLGMTTTVIIVQKGQAKVARLPLPSIYQQDGKPAVWLYNEQTSTVSTQPVEIQEYLFDGVLIRSGLKNGQIVVTAGVNKLHKGQKVRLMDADLITLRQADQTEPGRE